MARHRLGGTLFLGCALLAQAPAPPAAPKGPVLLAGEGFAFSGPDGDVHGFGASKTEHPMGNLARLAWLKFEGSEWAARDVVFKCTGALGGHTCGRPKGHGRVGLDAAAREDCGLAFLVWISASAEGWKKDYGDGVARLRLEDAFRPFLGTRLVRGDSLPAITPDWIGEGDLLRASPERFLAWLNDPEQSELLSRCRRTLGSRAFHFKDLAEIEDWWIASGASPAAGGAWVVGSNGKLLAVLHQPAAKSGAEGAARFKAILGIKQK
jgi:hypothetical protein